ISPAGPLANALQIYETRTQSSLELAVASIDIGRNEKVVGYKETTCTWYASVRQPSNLTDRGLRKIDQPRPWRIVWTAGTIGEADVGE
ncbi:MAG: hypothetical protein WBQ29_02850, partial [Isosphaeraceae bacterium]